MSLVPYSYGRSLLWDVTVVNTLAKSYQREALLDNGLVAEKAENRKVKKYSNIAAEQYTFIPIGFESMGSFKLLNSLLTHTLYKFQSQEARAEYGFVNAIVMNEAYVIGANRNSYLNLISIIIFGLTFIGIVLHATVRIIKKV